MSGGTSSSYVSSTPVGITRNSTPHTGHIVEQRLTGHPRHAYSAFVSIYLSVSRYWPADPLAASKESPRWCWTKQPVRDPLRMNDFVRSE